MRRVSAHEVRAALGQHRTAGFHVDSRLFREVEKPGDMCVLCLQDTDAFLGLVWQSIDAARPLVPIGEPRSLRDCASRLSAFGWDFKSLVEAGHSWFSKCVGIDASFDYSSLGWIAITPCNPSEKRETPGSTYYIYDGVHKSIVLAKKLLKNEVDYQPLEALLLTPRRS